MRFLTRVCVLLGVMLSVVLMSLTIGAYASDSVVYFRGQCPESLAFDCAFIYDVQSNTQRYWSRIQTNGSWTSDLSKYVFNGSQDSNGSIYMFQYPASRSRRIAEGNVANFVPTWSPDGTKIAYAAASSTPGKAVIRLITSSGDLYREYEIGNYPLPTTRAKWSANGQYLIVVGNEERQHAFDIWLIDTHDDTVSRLPGDYRPNSIWSPDDTTLLIEHSGTTVDLTIVPMTDTQLPIDLTTQFTPYYFTWLSDSSQIAYLNYQTGHTQISVLNVESSTDTIVHTFTDDAELRNWHWFARGERFIAQEGQQLYIGYTRTGRFQTRQIPELITLLGVVEW